MLLEVLFSVLALIAARVLWWRWKYDLHRIPSPPGWPLVGHMPYLRTGRRESEFSQFIGRSWKLLGQPKMFRLQIFGKNVVCVRDIDWVKHVALAKTNPLPKSANIASLLHPMMGNDPSAKSMVISPEVTPYVKAVRKVYLTAMQTSNLKLAAPKVNGVLDRMIEVIEGRREQGPIDFQELCVRTTLDTIGAVAFGMPLGGMDGHQNIYRLLIEAGHIGQYRRKNPIQAKLHKLFPSLKEAKRQRQVLHDLTAEWKELATEIRKRQDPPKGEEPIWYGLKQLIDPDTGRTLEYKSLVAEIATVVLGGMDTTGHQLAYILALLVEHPTAVAKLIRELEEQGHGGKSLTWEDLTELPYLSAIVKEGMRLAYVVNGVLSREVPHDMTILGHRVPKGTLIQISGTRWMNSVEDWGDPDAFRPERWLADEDMSRKYILGFSYGPRDCVGQKLATMVMRLAIARLVQHYSFTPTRPVAEIMTDTQNGVAIESIRGMWFHVRPRAEF